MSLFCVGKIVPQATLRVRPAVHVVPLDGVTPLGFCEVHSALHDWFDRIDRSLIVQIQPPLTIPVTHLGSLGVRGEVILVGSPVLPRAAGKVADDFVIAVR